MEIICLCCLAETTPTYKITTRCEFRAEESCENNQPVKTMELGELYTQFTQLPATLEIPSRANQLMCDNFCTRCVGMLKEFYMFRMTALKTREELQTKANIAKIINNLELNIDGAVGAADYPKEEYPQTVPKIEHCESSSNNGDGMFGCSICSKRFKQRKLLKRHAEIHSAQKNYHCQYCEMSFAAKVSCYNHELRVHRKLLKPNEEKKNAKRENSLSSVSKRKLTKLDPHKKSKYHEESEPLIEQKQFQCELCGNRFTRKSSLKDHKLILHAGVKQHCCQICNRTFGREGSLNTHMALHVGKKFRCKLCSKSFAKGSFLRKHLQEHEMPDSKRKYACTVCSKKFTTVSHLNDHVLIHSDKKPHKCSDCGRSFRQKQQLKVHAYQHVGKPFRCAYCNLAYTSRSRLQTHVNKHHSNEEVQSGNKIATAADTGNLLQPDFGDKAVNEEILNEICYQINSNPIILENIEAGGVNLICNENIVFLNE